MSRCPFWGQLPTHPARVALQELDFFIQLDVVGPQVVQLALQGLHCVLHQVILLLETQKGGPPLTLEGWRGAECESRHMRPGSLEEEVIGQAHQSGCQAVLNPASLQDQQRSSEKRWVSVPYPKQGLSAPDLQHSQPGLSS